MPFSGTTKCNVATGVSKPTEWLTSTAPPPASPVGDSAGVDVEWAGRKGEIQSHQDHDCCVSAA